MLEAENTRVNGSLIRIIGIIMIIIMMMMMMITITISLTITIMIRSK